MGLPGWTFLGVAVSATVIFYSGKLLEEIIGLQLERLPAGRRNLLVCSIVLLIGCLPILFAWLWQKSNTVIIKRDVGVPERKKGLIVLVSRYESAMFAIEYHLRDGGPLQCVWLIPSNGKEEETFGPATIAVANRIKEEGKSLAKSKGRDLRVVIHDEGVSPADAQDTFDYVNRVFRHAKYEPNEIIADFTGATKPMTVGMIMACLPRDRELEYVPYNQKTGEMSGPRLIEYEHRAFDLVG